MNRTIAFNLFIALVLCATAVQGEPSPEPATTQVVASGVSTDSDKALRNALMNAVEQAVGMVVDAETLVKNEEIVKDQVLTYSDGYVEKYEKLKEGKRDDGLFEVKIKAIIKRRQLVEKLRQSKVISTKVDGGSLFGEIVTQQEAAKNAATMLEKAFDGLPRSLIVAKVMDNKPRIIKSNNESVTLSWSVSVGYDWKQYVDNVLPALLRTLNDVALRKNDKHLNEQSDDPGLHDTEIEMRNVDIRTSFHFDGYDFWKERNAVKCKDEINERWLLINVSRSALSDRRLWALYVLDKNACERAINTMTAFQPIIDVDFMGSDGQIIHTVTINPAKRKWKDNTGRDVELFNTHLSFSFVRQTGSGVSIGPYVCINSMGSNMYGDHIIIDMETTMNTSDIKKIVEIRCSTRANK